MKFDKDYFIDNFPELNNVEIIETLESSGVFMKFDDEKIILQTGNEVKMIPMVLKGNIKVLQEDESGKEILLYYIKPGESCIMSILASKKNQRSSVRAITSDDSEILLFQANLVNIWSDKIKNWNEFVFNLYQKRFQELVHVINELAFSKVDKRILELLEIKSNINNNEIFMTHQQIANELGTAREVVSRLLKKLENDGKVKLMRGKIKFLSN